MNGRFCYRGTRPNTGQWTEIFALDSNGVREVQPRADLSLCPVRFDWGCGGCGAVHTSLALLSDYLLNYLGVAAGRAEQITLFFRDSFGLRVVACLPSEWTMQARVIEEFRLMHQREADGQPVDWSLWRSSIAERGLLIADTGQAILRGPSHLE